MKRIISIILTVIIAFSTFAIDSAQSINIYADENNKKVEWPSGPQVVGKCAVLIDASTGTVLYSKKADKQMYPASITKIMTALLTIENCKMDEMVEFSENAVMSLHYDDANFGCQVGEKMSVKDCLYLLMLHSANEVATALGEHVGGSEKDFAKMMTERAKQAGAKNTHFANANGLHNDKHYVTAYDMAMITRAALQYPAFREIVNTTSYKIGKNNKRKQAATCYQRHKMVWPTGYYYYDGIIGGKTGYTDQAGTTLVTSATRNGMTLISVVLKSNGTAVYKDTKALLDFGFDNFESLNVSKNDNRFAENNDTKDLNAPFCTESSSIFIDPQATVVVPKKVKFSELTSQVKFELTKDSFANITYQYNNKNVGQALIKYSSDKYEVSTKSEADNEKVTAATPVKPSKETEVQTEESKSFSLKLWKPTGKQIKNIVKIIIIAVFIIIIYLFIRKQRKKMNQIRNSKRHRDY